MLSNKNKSPDTLSRRQAKGIRRAYFSAVLSLTLCAVLSCPALATSGGGSDWGIVQLGMSIQSHDASQRTQGILCVFGGLLIAFSKEILSAIGVV